MLFRKRKGSATPPDEAHRGAIERRDEQEWRAQEAASAAAARERERAKVEAEAREASAEEIKRACRAVGFWWPGMPVPESRLGARPTWRERVVESIREAWRG